MSVICSMCDKNFANQSSHNRHVKEVHNTDPKPRSFGEGSRWGNRCLEENCENICRNRKELIFHLEKNHSRQFETYYSTMGSMDEFKRWKIEVEKEHGCYYVLKSKAATKSGEVLYYDCNRSKTSYSTTYDGEKKRRQRQGSCKMNNSCTSYIKVKNENGTYHIEWQKTHYGHKVELKHIRLPKLYRSCIASKFISGVTAQKILASTQDKKRSLNVESRDGKKHTSQPKMCDHLYSRESEDESVTENMSLYKSLVIPSKKNFNKETKIEQIKNLLTVLNNCDYEKLDYSVISHIHLNLLAVNNLTKCSRNPRIFAKKNKFECQKNTSKRITKTQLRFVSTKKQRFSDNTTLQKANVIEVQDNLGHTPEESFIVQRTMDPCIGHQLEI